MEQLFDGAISMVWKFGVVIIAFAAVVAFIKVKIAKAERRLIDKRRRERMESDMRHRDAVREKILQERRERSRNNRR